MALFAGNASTRAASPTPPQVGDGGAAQVAPDAWAISYSMFLIYEAPGVYHAIQNNFCAGSKADHGQASQPVPKIANSAFWPLSASIEVDLRQYTSGKMLEVMLYFSPQASSKKCTAASGILPNLYVASGYKT